MAQTRHLRASAGDGVDIDNSILNHHHPSRSFPPYSITLYHRAEDQPSAHNI
ncbi:hypothetical protein D9613_009538 [Agrocybe pediades]|uniref:Uncharacterized protein n=1 Tax=Agrocybe pediades TaxID=84607 RepID=A0A8H4R2A8_9AGAR|nr:hypothetical protein D9613_009538 [Agrocybe pediades]